MGSYCELSIDDAVVWSEKNHVPPGLDIVFVERDRFETPLECHEQDDRGVQELIGYRVSLRAARFRLAIRGYTLASAEAKYANWQREKRNSLDEFHAPEKLWDDFYSKHSFGDYLTLLKRVVLEIDDNDNLSADEEYILDPPSLHSYGFPAEDPTYALSVLLHSIDGDHVEVCLSEMIAGELWSKAYQLGGWSDGHLILLTEGKTDNEFLSKSFQLLYPDHMQTMRFFDYDFKPQGGANNNVNLLKSFAAAGISSPVLAIFDNDTAGHKALRDARRLSLPRSFMLASYPDIELASHYPTLGPSGMEELDVNGRACGIEMYFGKDCLTKNGELVPVRWTGYDEIMQRYQGEVGDKEYLHESFRVKLRAHKGGMCENCPSEWSELSSIMNTIEAAVLGNCLNGP